MSLRTQNKRLKRDALIQAARSLFEEQGFEATQMEEIAAQAGVSTATAYNYFESKANVLASIALLHLRSALPARRALLRKLPKDPLKGIIAYEELLARQALTTIGTNGWRVIFKASYDSPPSKLSRIGNLTRRIIHRHYQKLFRTYRDQGKLCPDIDINLAADLMTMTGTANFSRFITNDSMSMDERVAFIPRYADVILSLWLVADKAKS